MAVHESKFCKICGTLFGEDGCEHEPSQADMVFLPEYFELADGKGNLWWG